jgi:argininosuccinate lyase
LSRLAQDLYVWSTDEFGLIEFPDRVAGTSSIMPQKKNHVVLEYLKATSAQSIGELVSMLGSMRATHFTNSVDGVRIALKGGWQVLEATGNSLILGDLVVRSLKPKSRTMLKRIQNSFATVTSLAEFLVQQCDISFRDAHHIGGTLVRIALDRGLDVGQLDSELIDEAAERVIGRKLNCTSVDIASALDPRKSLEERRSAGGPSPAEVARLLNEAASRLEGHAAEVAALEAKLHERRTALKTQIAVLAAD